MWPWLRFAPNGGSGQHPEKSEPVSRVQIQPGIRAWHHCLSISSSLSNMATVWETDSTFVPQLSQDGWLALLAFLPTKDAARLDRTHTPSLVHLGTRLPWGCSILGKSEDKHQNWFLRPGKINNRIWKCGVLSHQLCSGAVAAPRGSVVDAVRRTHVHRGESW